jgi:uncharacterized protein YfdQ (DUF2303 family)
MSINPATTEAAQVAALAVASAEVRTIDGKPFITLPEGCSVHDLEEHLLAPQRKSGTVHLRDAASFIAVVNAHKGAGSTLYRTVQPPRFEAVFNDHVPNGSAAGWGDHVAVYACPLSPEWAAWTGMNKRQLSQADFAQFIEDNLPDVVDPAAAAMLEISRTLQAKKKVAFASGVRLSNGETQFTYDEKVEGTAGGRGQFQVPEVFTIGVPVFEGGPRYAVKARLRYRISDQGALALWFDLERPHKIIEDAVAELNKAIEAGTSMLSLNGSRAD